MFPRASLREEEMAARATAECAFADNGQYLANISSDGRLKIWESGSAKQEYTPASHLSATCTCLVWAPFKHSEQVGFYYIGLELLKFNCTKSMYPYLRYTLIRFSKAV